MSVLSEVETQDALVFVKGASPSFQAKDKIVAPSIEEVNDDPELLRSLRGQGRYFGIDDEDNGIKNEELKCKNCSQHGHIKKNCPHVICSYCGFMDDHYSQHCPRTMRCSHCNESGHYRQHCTQKWKRIFCTSCNSKKHSRDRCPSVWRSYCLDNADVKRVLPSNKVYCYNCAEMGHFGDECPRGRSSRVPNDDGSAFSGDNLAASLRRKYFTGLARFKRDMEYESDYCNEGYNFSAFSNNEDNVCINYDDYEVDETHYTDHNKNRNRKRKQYKNESVTNQPPMPSNRGKLLEPHGQRNKHMFIFSRAGSSSRAKSNSGSRYSPQVVYHKEVGRNNYNSHRPFRTGTLLRRP